ncbi:ScbA/BarX family gamma-butyrolactone biosynthesis protein [Streptomyces sp. NPDC001843]|uniref:ScbA/BarX family gamma-butyrolactone biosynthesis protein n=1 Tax=Streptomyces sp. NPDC001843 TaxID=3364617 RepID=UPI003694249E
MSLHTAQHRFALPTLPRLTTTVPKEYVHRASLAEVFLTGCTSHDDQRFSLTGQWPRAHTLFRSYDGASHDPLQVAETFRQAGIFLAHAELDVPLGHRFVMWNLSYTTYPEQLRIASAPTDFDLEARCAEITWRRGIASSMRMELAIRRDGELVASGAGTFSTTPPAVYQRLRANRKASSDPVFDLREERDPLVPHTVGRTSAADVVLSATGNPTRWMLTPDLEHPIFFDHSDDHMPGMVLLEGARQAACAAVAPQRLTPASASTEFCNYAELDSPCWIDVTDVVREGSGMMTVQVAGQQNGKTVFVSTITGPVG